MRISCRVASASGCGVVRERFFEGGELSAVDGRRGLLVDDAEAVVIVGHAPGKRSDLRLPGGLDFAG